MPPELTFRCAECGEIHDLSELSLGFDAPLQWVGLTDGERSRSQKSDDQCIIESAEGRGFYLRGTLDIPVRETDTQFCWGLWVSLSEASFIEVQENWENPARVSMGPYFGWLCNLIPGYPDTALLKTRVHNRPVGMRPSIELGPTEHPLAIHQRRGIDREELFEILTIAMHSN